MKPALSSNLAHALSNELWDFYCQTHDNEEFNDALTPVLQALIEAGEYDRAIDAIKLGESCAIRAAISETNRWLRRLETQAREQNEILTKVGFTIEQH